MGLFELHLHDAEFRWSLNLGRGKERSLSFTTERGSGGGSKSKLGRKLGSKLRSRSPNTTGSSSEGGRPAKGSKLGSLAALGLVIGAAMAFNRLQSRRQRETAKTESATPGRRSSLFRGK